MVRHSALQNDILRYIIENNFQPGDPLPTIQELSQDLEVSVAKTRESLEIARTLGLVDIKPGRGTRVESYRFAPAVTLSVLYAIGLDAKHFSQLQQVRNALEIQFWGEATQKIAVEDIAKLRALILSASQQLDCQPVQMPVNEHRSFHLVLFSHLENQFVQGILEAFWNSYEAFGLHFYRDLAYHHRVWDYHSRIVDAVERGDVETGRQLMIEHMNLLTSRAADEIPNQNGSHYAPFFE